ncbi:MAG: dihydropteroate synthase, partial [Caldithrix sp.]|nr:dihydropteroate synthase [Caldithrix sp.]
MGILNVTPDSFSDGGAFYNVEDAVGRGLQMTEEGAHIIDVGGESTRPGAEPVDTEEEIKRIIPVIKRLRTQTSTLISVDTYKSEVATAALDAGADIVNDISGLQFDHTMVKIIEKYRCPVIVMHIKGNPGNMQLNPHYDNVFSEIYSYFEERISDIGQTSNDKIILDPGIGFGKRLEDNIQIIKNLQKFGFLGYPLMVGTSRKSFIGKLLKKSTEERLSGSIASELVSILNGADIIRVHDVKETVDVI